MKAAMKITPGERMFTCFTGIKVQILTAMKAAMKITPGERMLGLLEARVERISGEYFVLVKH